MALQLPAQALLHADSTATYYTAASLGAGAVLLVVRKKLLRASSNLPHEGGQSTACLLQSWCCNQFATHIRIIFVPQQFYVNWCSHEKLGL